MPILLRVTMMIFLVVGRHKTCPFDCANSARRRPRRTTFRRIIARALPRTPDRRRPLTFCGRCYGPAAMRSLLHMPFDPACRLIRLMLAEKGLAARFVETPPWSRENDLVQHNPAMTVPVLIDEPPTGGEVAVAPVSAIAEYLEEAYREPSLLPATSAARAEARRLVHWFDQKFESEVNALIVRRRIDGKLQGRRWGDPEPIRAAIDAIAWHLDYLSYLLERRAFLAGDRLTLADLAGAAHLSVNDYFGLVPWADFLEVKSWYQRMKSRPSMRPILADRLSNTPPAAHYADLDF